jgi:hypothetical protein
MFVFGLEKVSSNQIVFKEIFKTIGKADLKHQLK